MTDVSAAPPTCPPRPAAVHERHETRRHRRRSSSRSSSRSRSSDGDRDRRRHRPHRSARHRSRSPSDYERRSWSRSDRRSRDHSDEDDDYHRSSRRRRSRSPDDRDRHRNRRGDHADHHADDEERPDHKHHHVSDSSSQPAKSSHKLKWLKKPPPPTIAGTDTNDVTVTVSQDQQSIDKVSADTQPQSQTPSTPAFPFKQPILRSVPLAQQRSPQLQQASPSQTQSTMIEVMLDDRLGRKVRVKVNSDDTVLTLKKLTAARIGTLPERLQIKKWYTVYKDHVRLDDYEIHDGMGLELYYK